jgi:hypothetical protein
MVKRIKALRHKILKPISYELLQHVWDLDTFLGLMADFCNGNNKHRVPQMHRICCPLEELLSSLFSKTCAMLLVKIKTANVTIGLKLIKYDVLDQYAP